MLNSSGNEHSFYGKIKSYWGYLSKNQKIAFLILVFLFLILSLSLLSISQQKDIRSKAENTSFLPTTASTIKYNLYFGKNIGGINKDISKGAVRDANGNVYIIGDFTGEIDFGIKKITETGPFGDGFIAKYDAKGNILWVKQIGLSQDYQYTTDVVVDQNSNVYVLGGYDKTISVDTLTVAGVEGINIFTAKFSPEGKTIWLRNESKDKDSSKNTHDHPVSLAIDNSYNYYISNRFSEFPNPDMYYLRKILSDGNLSWKKETGMIKDIVTNQNNDLFITGDKVLIKYDTQGNEIFKKEDIYKFGGGNSLIIDTKNNIIVTGFYDIFVDPIADIPDRDVLIVKYDASGSKIWEKNIKFSNGEDIGDVINIDYENNIYISGRKYDGFNQNDIFISIFDVSGNSIYSDSFGNSSYNDSVQSLLVDNNKNIYMVGGFQSSIRYNTTYIYSKGSDDIYFINFLLDQPLPTIIPPSNPGKAIFINSGSYVAVKDISNKLIMTPQFTFEAWVKPEINPNNYTAQTIIKINTTDFSNDYLFHLYHEPQELNALDSRLTLSIGRFSFRSNKNLPLNTWSHVALVRNGTKITLYIDGLFIQEFDLPTNENIPKYPSGSAFIGSEVYGTGTNLQFQGTIDDMRFSNITRDILENWNRGIYFKPLIPDTSTLALWKFESDYKDTSFFNNHGEPHGTIVFVDGIVSLITPSPTPTIIQLPTSTLTPTPTIGISNGAFELDKNPSDSSPDNWIRINLTTSDILVTNERHSPKKSFRMTGLATGGKIKILEQEIANYKVSKGKIFSLSGWNKLNAPLNSGKAVLTVLATNTDGTKTNYKVPFDSTITNWQQEERCFSLAKDAQRLRVRLKYSGTGTRTFFDDIKFVSRSSCSSFTPPSDADPDD